MNRRNYGGSSAVIIDLCKTDGIWFDADELARILVWIRAGGVERPKPEPKPRSEEEDYWRAREALGPPYGGFGGGFFDQLIGGLVRGAWRWW
jgi:hypothetical protein